MSWNYAEYHLESAADLTLMRQHGIGRDADADVPVEVSRSEAAEVLAAGMRRPPWAREARAARLEREEMEGRAA